MTKLRTDIINLLREDARISAADIAKMLGATEKEVAAEIAALEDGGIIRKYTVVVDDELAGKIGRAHV